MIQLAVALAFTFVFIRPELRLALVPSFVKRTRGREAAARAFSARGLARTRGRTGVLLFVSAAERYAEVVADEGIAVRVDERAWRDIITELIESIRRGRAADGITVAVQRVGQILTEHVALQGEDSDDLPNKVILI